MVDGQDVVAVDAAADDGPMVLMPAQVAFEAIEAIQLLRDNGTWTDEYPWLPSHDAVLRFNVLARLCADAELDPKFAIENAEKYIAYILHGAPKPEAEPVTPLKRRFKAV